MSLIARVQSNIELTRLETQLGELVRIVAHLNKHVNRLEQKIETQQRKIDTMIPLPLKT